MIVCSRSLSSAIKVAIFEKPPLVYLETLQQVAKIDHVQGQNNTVLEMWACLFTQASVRAP